MGLSKVICHNTLEGVLCASYWTSYTCAQFDLYSSTGKSSFMTWSQVGPPPLGTGEWMKYVTNLPFRWCGTFVGVSPGKAYWQLVFRWAMRCSIFYLNSLWQPWILRSVNQMARFSSELLLRVLNTSLYGLQIVTHCRAPSSSEILSKLSAILYMV